VLTSGGSNEPDSLFKIVRHLATVPQLTTLHLTGCHVISEGFFRDLPSFPVLSDFQLNFSASSADGHWFFVPDKDLIAKIREQDEQQSLHYDPYDEQQSLYNDPYASDSDSDSLGPVELWDDEDEDGPLLQRGDIYNHFRTMPNPEYIPTLLIDAAKMVASNPTLRKFILRHRHSSQFDEISWADPELIPYGRHLEVWYLKAGTHCDHQSRRIPADEPFVHIDRMYWRVGERWRPDVNIIKAWQTAVGSDVNYCYLKDFYGDYGHSVAWQSAGEDYEYLHYVFDPEWEKPGGVIDLELNELKKAYDGGRNVYGPWPESTYLRS
jgi:hypothetical protein